MHPCQRLLDFLDPDTGFLIDEICYFLEVGGQVAVVINRINQCFTDQCFPGREILEFQLPKQVLTQRLAGLVGEVVDRMNRPSFERLAEERPHLRPLPSSRVPTYTVYRVKVRKWSTIRISNKTYSVPSRLRGHTVEARQYANEVEIVYAGQVVERMPRLRGGREHRIDYRHVIWSLVHKPGAFARYRYREELFPTQAFREAYDALVRLRG